LSAAPAWAVTSIAAVVGTATAGTVAVGTIACASGVGDCTPAPSLDASSTIVVAVVSACTETPSPVVPSVAFAASTLVSVVALTLASVVSSDFVSADASGCWASSAAERSLSLLRRTRLSLGAALVEAAGACGRSARSSAAAVASSSIAANWLGVPFDAASGPAARRGLGCS
jgi:hypothetical protein